MRNADTRLRALESKQNVDNPENVRVIFHTLATHNSVAGNVKGALVLAIVIPPGSKPGKTSKREAGETERAFLERIAGGYEKIHGPVPDDWFDDMSDEPLPDDWGKAA